MKYTLSALLSLCAFFQATLAQQEKTDQTGSLKLSAANSQNLEQTIDKREQAYAKLLEGQRHIWKMYRSFSDQNAFLESARKAREALQKAGELSPNLDEAYTALSEVAWLEWLLQPKDSALEDSINFANAALKINPNSFGGRSRLAMIYTLKSGIRENRLDPALAEKAIEQWKEIARLDPRNAETFAFLSALYEKSGNKKEQIEALKKWLTAASPVNPRFYMSVMGAAEDLAPSSATVKLGKVLLEGGRVSEALDYLKLAIADDPKNEEALGLFAEAIESADEKELAGSVETLQSAVFVNPDNGALISLLADVYARSGKIENAAKLLRGSVEKLAENDKYTAANLQTALGDVYLEAEKFDDAVREYEKALAVREIADVLVTDSDRSFAAIVYDKILLAHRNSNRTAEAIKKIEEARVLFGKDDLFADRKLIDLHRENGNKQEALKIVRGMRARYADDYSLLRLEAELLTNDGKVEEGVGLVKTLINPKNPVLSAQYDDYSNYIFISMLYMEANRGKDAVKAANQAITAAKTDDQKMYARISLASALQVSGDYAAAEQTLRAMLKQTPGNPIALNNLGYFLLERNERFEEARGLIEQALEIDPNNPSYLDSLGWVFFKMGKYAEAEKYLKKAVQLAPASSTIQEHLGDVFQKQNKLEKAKAAWRKALNLSSDSETIERIKSKLSK